MPRLQDEIGSIWTSKHQPVVVAHNFAKLGTVIINVMYWDIGMFGGIVYYASRLENQGAHGNKLHG